MSNIPIKISMNLSRMDLMNQNIMNLILENERNQHINYEVTESAYSSLSSKCELIFYQHCIKEEI